MVPSFFLFLVNPCELHCRPLNETFSEKMQDAVVDGTPCYEGNKSRDMCINGICKVSICYHLLTILFHFCISVSAGQ